jgi:outer membrane protein TolC
LQTGEDRRLLGFEAADAFLLTIGTEQVEGAAVRRVEYARNAVTDAQARFDAGLVGSNDVTRAQLEAASAERSLANARTLMRNAYLQLGNLLDTKVEPPLVVPEAMLDSAASVTPDVAAVGNAAQSRRLDLAASRARAEALHFSAQEPLLRAVPNFTFGALSDSRTSRAFRDATTICRSASRATGRSTMAVSATVSVTSVWHWRASPISRRGRWRVRSIWTFSRRR